MDEPKTNKDPNALVMDNGKVYKIQKVRQRKIHSCVPCHSRKIKCSREHPICQNCSKNSLECKYFVNDRVSRGKKNKNVDKETDLQRKQELKGYMLKAKTMVDNLSKSPTLPEKDIIVSTKDAAVIPNKSNSDQEDSISPSSSTQDFDKTKDKSLTYSDSESHTSNESLSPPKLHNPQVLPTDKKNYTNPGFSVYDQKPDQNLNNSILNDFQIRQTPQPSIPVKMQYNDYSLPSATQLQPFNTTSLNSFNFGLPLILMPKQPDNIPSEKLEEIFGALPSKERSYMLVKRFIKVIHPILPILDVNEFTKQHDEFWEDKIENKLEFVSLLLTVLYAASKAECFEFSYDEITKFGLSNEIHKYLRVARVALTAINYPQVFSLKVLQSAVILQSTLENPSLIDVSILVRIAHMIKLHRDPATFHNISDPSLVQLRRLLWWQIFYLDAMTSLKQMNQPIIRLDEFDTSLPVEYLGGSLYFEMCFLNGKFRFSLILSELTRFIYGINILPYNTIQILKQKILDLHISCNASIMNLESFERSAKLSFDELNFIHWSKSVLSTYSDRALLLLQKKIILAHVININEEGNHQIFSNSYNQMVNNKKSQFSINSLFNGNSNQFNPEFSTMSSYSYDDLSNNLIPASLHYLYEFLKNNNDDIYNGFNWEIRNHLPFDAILLVLTNLISDLEKNQHQKVNYELRNDIRYHILDKTLDLIFIKFDNKKRSIIKNCFTLIRYLFQILRLKYLRNDNGNSNLNDFDNYYTDQVIPKPINSSSNIFKRESSISPSSLNNTNALTQSPNSVNSIISSSSNIAPVQTASCSQIAPRTMRAVAGGYNSTISFSETQSNNLIGVSVSDMFVNGLTSDVNINGLVSTQISNTFIGDGIVDESYKEHELLRIKSQITKFLREERLNDDDPFNNKFYISIEHEVKSLIQRLI